MRTRNIACIVGLAALAACSGSPESMLQSGDPKVCVSDAILSQAYDVVRENAQAPRDELLAERYDELKAGWLAKLSFVAGDVTSTSVDRANQSVECSGTLHISAEGVEGSEDAPFAYQVKANLSDPRSPIISVDVSALRGPLATMLGKVARPDSVNAQSSRDESDDALTKLDEDEVRNTPGALEKLQARSRENLVQNNFSASELALVDRVYSSHMMCAASDARNRDAHCRKERRLEQEAKSIDLCRTAGNEWYHCSREAELQEQRDALRGTRNDDVVEGAF